ncbi:MAG: hypothetical protein Q4F66_02455 [Clostridium sp.]|nr:hypothetical protein [Clostridium sp.]
MYSKSIDPLIDNLFESKSSSNNEHIQRPSQLNKHQYNYKPDDFMNITSYKGFDNNDPGNGRQNNYAWSFCDFNGYIYVGTGRNVTYGSLAVMAQLEIPLDYTPDSVDMCAEIWRYKKDGSLPWERVYKSKFDKSEAKADVVGIRSLIKFKSFGLKPAMYAAGYSMNGIKILKSTNGVDWFEIPSNITKGTSSRSMIVYNNKLYLTVMADAEDLPSLLYSSVDPELFGWTLETPENGEDGKNPIGTIWTIAAFNNHLYLGTSSKKGFMLWRTEGSVPEINHWKLVIKNGGGNDFNYIPISLVEFKGHLYVGTGIDTTSMLCYVFPVGSEIFRVDKNDNYKTIVGYNDPLSCLSGGFNNPYNLYMWQMKVFNNKLYIGTFDCSTAIEPTLETFLKNADSLIKLFTQPVFESLVSTLYSRVLSLKNNEHTSGFDFYVSKDGINFSPICIDGFNNPYSYGIRNIFISDDNNMYIGTANPFQGCEVYELIQDSVFSLS